MSEPVKPPLIHEITPRNILSFGPETAPIELSNLNVIIGPNGSGKSNLLEVISILRAAPQGMRSEIQRAGGIFDLPWKGARDSVPSIDAVIDNPRGRQALRHIIRFKPFSDGFSIDEERIEYEKKFKDFPTPLTLYHYETGRKPFIRQAPLGRFLAALRGKASPTTGEPKADFQAANEEEAGTDYELSEIVPWASVLEQRRDPDLYPALSHLAVFYGAIRLFREWAFGRNATFRQPQQADLRTEFLEEDFSNLGMVLNRLKKTLQTKKILAEKLGDLYEGLEDFEIEVKGGAVQVFFQERALRESVPARRLSDGSLRYLCLLAILCDPDPPPLICLEEPELGLHPDLIHKIADLLVEASDRTQLIVTTHSDILVDAFTERPEAVMVCEKHDGQTMMRRLTQGEVAPFLEMYRLGTAWTKGEIGGTRW